MKMNKQEACELIHYFMKKSQGYYLGETVRQGINDNGEFDLEKVINTAGVLNLEISIQKSPLFILNELSKWGFECYRLSKYNNYVLLNFKNTSADLDVRICGYDTVDLYMSLVDASVNKMALDASTGEFISKCQLSVEQILSHIAQKVYYKLSCEDLCYAERIGLECDGFNRIDSLDPVQVQEQPKAQELPKVQVQCKQCGRNVFDTDTSCWLCGCVDPGKK